MEIECHDRMSYLVSTFFFKQDANFSVEEGHWILDFKKKLSMERVRDRSFQKEIQYKL